jgi:CRISPR-associated protein Cmr2
MNPKKSLLAFSFGPVQDFIAASRKTRDLFGGSALLSYLSDCAVREIVNYNWSGGPLGNSVLAIPALPEGADFKGTGFPNRFLAVVPRAEARLIAEKAERAVRDELARVVKRILEIGSVRDLTRNILGDQSRGFLSQINNFIECYWASVPWDGEPGTYGRAYNMAEILLGQRKLVREFSQTNETGEKCSLIPSLVDVTGGSRSAGGERLSAVAIVKRFFPERSEADSAFPSTSSVAVGDFVSDVVRCEAGVVHELARAFAQSVNSLTKNSPSRPLNLIESVAREKGLSEFASIDGDWFFEEQYESESLRKVMGIERGGWEHPKSKADAARSALRVLLKKTGEMNISPPSRYYGIIRFDGDRVGKWLSGEFGNTIGADIQRKISSRLVEFTASANEIVERKHLGRIIYAGGDDVLAFVTIRNLLPVAREIRYAYRIMESTLEGKNGEKPTGSMGVVIAHHREDLKTTMAESRNAEHFAKENLGRDAVAISVLKRSGDHTTSGTKWYLADGTEAIGVLEEFGDMIVNGRLARGFVYDVASESDLLFAVSEAAARHEFERLFRRRLSDEGGEVADKRKLGLFFEKIWNLIVEERRRSAGHSPRGSPESAIALLAAAQFIAKGGNE